ncbi:sensor histidine kinase [Parabacteroides johnsonii DSM 18315]|uniref:Sensor histidine kinase n=1 Tax=Parabacteroides johnsonii DSM 18315 TaxID=537006 RepID=B7BBZ5_9BACT|nr:sensor histidine kinase [Parabacteroides johnsonii DSM 18315]
MKSIYDSRQRLKFVFIFTAILIAIASLVVSDMLIKDLAQEERQKMEVWAEATRLTASKNTAVDLSLVLKILEGNTTIPVVLCNDKDSIMFVKNINFPENNDVEEFKESESKGAEKQKYDCDRYGGWNFPICLL